MVVRSALFNAAFYVWTVGLAIAHLSFMFFVRREVLARTLAWWSRSVVAMMRATCNIVLDVRGRDNLVPGPAIVVAKHQSAFDTLVWHALLPDPAMVLKKELTWIPIYGQLASRLQMIPVDRGAGGAAIKSLLRGGETAAKQGRHIVIFPQGTRTAPGTPVEDVPYHPGATALYSRLKLPVVPVALNTGLFWPRRTFLRYPGTMVIEYLEPIPPGLPRAQFQTLLEDRIESATRRLEAEAEARR
ncbi:MAG: lysophospholipid acyltransferase family protein [Alphaproteobacteria bacterium]